MTKTNIGMPSWKERNMSNHNIEVKKMFAEKLKEHLDSCLATDNATDDDVTNSDAKKETGTTAAQGAQNKKTFAQQEVHAIRKLLDKADTVDAATVLQMRMTYAKLSAVRFHAPASSKDITADQLKTLGEMISFYAPNAELIQPTASVFYIRHLAQRLHKESGSAHRKIANYDPLNGSIFQNLGKSVEAFSTKAKGLSDISHHVDPCDHGKCEEVLRALCEFLTELQKQYQAIICQMEEAIQWPSFQPIMEEPLRAVIGRLGYALTSAWITFREIECPCVCDRDHLVAAWRSINTRAVALRADITNHFKQQLCPPDQFCDQSTQAIIAASEQGLAAALNVGEGQLSSDDQHVQTTLAMNAEREATQLSDKLSMLKSNFKSDAMNHIWPELATILFCVDQCKKPDDECESLRQHLNCLVDAWGKLSSQAAPVSKKGATPWPSTKPQARPMNAAMVSAPSTEINQLIGSVRASLVTASPRVAEQMNLALRDLEAAARNSMGVGAQLFLRGQARIQSLNITPQAIAKTMMAIVPSKSKNCGCTA